MPVFFVTGFAQPNPFSTPGVFKVIDIQTISANYMIVSCIDGLGRTFQFQAPVPNDRTEILGTVKSKPFTLALGVILIPDFITEKASPATDNTIHYTIIKPSLSNQCCSITEIVHLMNQYNYFVIAKKDTANGLTYFSIKRSLTIHINPQINQPIYQKFFNNKRYAILTSLPGDIKNKNMFYSYEFDFMSNEVFNSLPKEEMDTTTNSGNTGNVISLPSIDSNQVEISTIMNGQNMTTGYISINALSDAECSINIYNPTDHKLLFNSSQLRIFSLLPGKYDTEISGVILVNLYVFKGKSTRIKSGTLNITSPSLWTLYDSNKVKTIYTSSLPKKVEFPRGIYQLEINGSVHRIEIKDGENLNFSDSTSQPQTQKLNTSINDKQWVITQNLLTKGATGKLFLNLPKGAESIITISQPVTERQVSYSLNDHAFSLVPGTYDVTLSGSKVKGVPIQKGMDTRIKAGVLNVVATGTWTLYDEKKDRQVYYSNNPKQIGLPIGTYQLEINGTKQLVVIKDGETVDF